MIPKSFNCWIFLRNRFLLWGWSCIGKQLPLPQNFCKLSTMQIPSFQQEYVLLILFVISAIKIAGMLARAGDYSQFETVAAWIADGKRYGRLSAICELANFRHKTDPVTDAAIDILVSVADTDPEPFFRQVAIYSLEKIAKEKPQIIPKLIDLGITSRMMLKIYELKRNEEEGKQP